jgi:hypothetical protein
LRGSNKNFRAFIWGCPIGYIFGVHFQCRSNIFLDGSR